MDSDAASRVQVRPGFPWALLWFAVALFCLAAAVYFGGRERQYVDETIGLRGQLESTTAALAEWEQARAILAASGTVAVPFGPERENAVSGTLFVNAGRGIALVGAHLPPVSDGKLYEMWLLQEGQEPSAAGLFRPGPDGSAIHVDRSAPVTRTPFPPGARIEVTIENAGGALRPSSAPLITATLPALPPKEPR